jgi:hypothetical protein
VSSKVSSRRPPRCPPRCPPGRTPSPFYLFTENFIQSGKSFFKINVHNTVTLICYQVQYCKLYLFTVLSPKQLALLKIAKTKYSFPTVYVISSYKNSAKLS